MDLRIMVNGLSDNGARKGLTDSGFEVNGQWIIG